MNISPYKTPLIHPGDDLTEIISQSIDSIPEESVLVVSSKVVSFWEGRLVPKKTGTLEEKVELIKKEADYYLPNVSTKYRLMFTIKGNWMFASAGIDESNSDNHYTLWPKDPQASANKIWQFLRDHYQIKHVGVILTDSRSQPLNWGVTGHGIAHCGFKTLKDYRGSQDLHGRNLKVEQLNLVQAMSASAAMEMGEGNEQRPLALISDITQDIEFQNHHPTHTELEDLHIDIQEDIYAPILTKVDWKKGGSSK